MKLKDYAEYIVQLALDHPNALVIYSSDEEGNSYREANFEPSLVNYNPEDHTIVDETDLMGTGEEFDNDTLVKAVCIN